MALADNITSYWKLDETGGNAADSVASYTLTNNGTATFTTGKINNAGTFNGTSQSFNNNSVWGALSYPHSFSGWFNLDTVATDQSIFAIGDGSVHYYTLKLRASDGKLVFRSNNTTQAGDVDTGTTISTGTWYHFVVVQNSSTSVTIYVNGSVTNTAAATYVATVSQFYIGYLGRSSAWWLDGKIDEVGVWNRTLTSGEVTQLYNSGSGNQYPFGTAYSLVMAVGAFTLTGIATVFNKALGFIMSAGSFTLTGINALFAIGIGFVAEVGAFILTGIDALFRSSSYTKDPKPSSNYSEDSKPSSSYTEDTKPSDTWINDSK